MAPAHTHHHTIPAGYLRGFASPVRNRPKLEVLDLLGVVSSLRQGSDLLSWLFTTFDLDQIFRAGQPHQGLSSRRIAAATDPRGRGPLARRQRLGGLLNHYYREAA